MVDRIKTAVAARRDPNFVIMARTDALANEGLDAAIKRAEVKEKGRRRKKKEKEGGKEKIVRGKDTNFVIMTRTDALANEGLDAVKCAEVKEKERERKERRK
jgi:2-methylisocitrate lyase-like PEP mutase family enzyme